MSFHTLRFQTGRLMRDERGAVAILFGLMCVVLLGIVGAAIDYERALSVQSRLQQAIDSAVLAAARDPDATDDQVKALAEAYIAQNTKQMMAESAANVSVTRSTGSSVEVTINAASKSPSRLLTVLGIDALDVSVSATAGMKLGEEEIYAAIDMSESMGIAADPPARAAMQNLTRSYLTGSKNPEGCSFGCHMRDGWEPAGQTVYQMAKAAGIAMREDVLRTAFAVFVDTVMAADDPAVGENRKRMAVTGFSDDLKVLQTPTNDVSVIKAAPDTFPDSMRNNTVFKTALPKIRTLMGSQGSGVNGVPRKTLLLITDGVAWMRNSGDPDNGTLDPALCESFKGDGIDVAVIEVKYQKANGEYWFDLQVDPFYEDISPALKDCASPGLFFEATDSDATTLAESFKTAGRALKTALALRK